MRSDAREIVAFDECCPRIVCVCVCLSISNFCGPDIRDMWQTPRRYRSIRPRRPTDERVMPIRFGYRGRLAGTYEKISFPTCVTTNWYEATPLSYALLWYRCSFSIFYRVFLLCHRKMRQMVGASWRFESHWFRVTRKQPTFSNSYSFRIME